MILKIKNIKNFGVFNKDLIDHPSLEFKRYNLIYGWNASGKTTLSRLLRCFELETIHSDFPNSEFQLQMEDKSSPNHKNLDKISNIRVFNKDFIDENIFTGEGRAKPIYYIGEEDIEKKKKLENLKKIRECKENKKDSKQKYLQEKEKEEDNFIKSKSSEIKNVLRTGENDEYTNYDKSNFKSKIKQIDKETHKILPENELDQKKIRIKQNLKGNIDFFQEKDLFDEQDIKDVNEILEKEVISEIIEKLKHNEDLNKWIKEGLSLYNQSDKSICHFCEQPVSKQRIESLEKHFNDDYKDLMSKVDSQKKVLESKKNKSSELNKDSLYDDLSSEFEVRKNELDKEIEKYNQFIVGISDQIDKKKNNPFQKMKRINYKYFEINNLIQRCNDFINKHNEKTMNFNAQRLKEKKDIENHFLSKSQEEYENFESTIIDFENNIKNLKDEVSKIDIEINQLFHTERDYKITAQEINKKLRKFLYREELIFEAAEEQEDGYYIKRYPNGEFAKSLSEGEKTAIALMYFLSKLKEENFDLCNGIIVIDDPISSLDSNSIYQAFGFIKSEISDANQIFILTHNFDFFKNVKHWFKRDYMKDKSKRMADLFMIKNFYEEKKRMATVSPLDNLLKKYNSEYHYLFKLLYDSRDMESFVEVYPLPNVARKFMETFLPFKFPSETNHDKLFSKAKKKVGFDPEKIEKIKRFINAHSHADIDEMTGWDISQWSEGKDIIRDILDLVKKLDEEHYEGLCKALNKSTQ